MRQLPISLILLTFVSCAHPAATEATAAPGNPAPGEAPPPGEGPPPDDGSPLITPKEVAWKDMTPQQRGRYMRKAVMPKMRDVFLGHDPEQFKKPSCATCHGKNAKANKFKMPNPELPVLPASAKEFMATVMKDKPEMVKFMGETVTPTMADLLNLKPFDPHAPDPNAFSCHNCHTLKGTPDPE